jgi:hypothetical protein
LILIETVVRGPRTGLGNVMILSCGARRALGMH